MPLNTAQRTHLRRLGHALEPVVLVGQNGISPNLVAEFERALNDHELVKVRARVGDRKLRDEILDELARSAGAEIIQRVGHVALYYRRDAGKPGILLPG
jgi:RNA-binding protein